ncbi:MAG: ABC transporter ATP-binding protein [Lachnospiraceae bacterium]|nr:ABC transporter ATP-binding protein [Lachnospiraceae bacterium]
MEILLKNLTKKFPNRNKSQGGYIVAVDHVDLTIPDGKLVGLLGPSGCGKSTALNLISGLEKPTEGQIIFGDRDVTDITPQERGVGLVFQSYALYPHLNVERNIRFPLENLKGKDKLTKEEMAKRVMEVAKLVEIDDYLERRPSELSGGQQQRVAIARALVKNACVLLLDEPLSNLDARLRLQTREEIRRIQKQTNITTVFVTHDQDEAMSICDLIAVMNNGAVMQMGRPQDVYDDPSSLFVAKFLGTPPINVFNGHIGDGGLYIGKDRVFDLAGQQRAERDVFVAIRPEGFIPDDNGKLICTPGRIEVLGRDVSILSGHEALISDTGLIRSIVDSDAVKMSEGRQLTFSLKKHKVFVFDRESELRIPFEVRDE